LRTRKPAPFRSGSKTRSSRWRAERPNRRSFQCGSPRTLRPFNAASYGAARAQRPLTTTALRCRALLVGGRRRPASTSDPVCVCRRHPFRRPRGGRATSSFANCLRKAMIDMPKRMKGFTTNVNSSVPMRRQIPCQASPYALRADDRHLPVRQPFFGVCPPTNCQPTVGSGASFGHTCVSTTRPVSSHRSSSRCRHGAFQHGRELERHAQTGDSRGLALDFDQTP
jgi:hypothetical protein